MPESVDGAFLSNFYLIVPLNAVTALDHNKKTDMQR